MAQQYHTPTRPNWQPHGVPAGAGAGAGAGLYQQQPGGGPVQFRLPTQGDSMSPHGGSRPGSRMGPGMSMGGTMTRPGTGMSMGGSRPGTAGSPMPMGMRPGTAGSGAPPMAMPVRPGTSGSHMGMGMSDSFNMSGSRSMQSPNGTMRRSVRHSNSSVVVEDEDLDGLGTLLQAQLRKPEPLPIRERAWQLLVNADGLVVLTPDVVHLDGDEAGDLVGIPHTATLQPHDIWMASVKFQDDLGPKQISKVADTAAKGLLALPENKQNLANFPQPVPYQPGMYSGSLDARDASKFAPGTAVSSLHKMFEYPPNNLVFLHIDDIANGFPKNTPMTVKAFNGKNVVLGAPHQVNMNVVMAQLGVMNNLEVLYLRHAGLTTIKWLNAPRLRQLDLTGNLLHDIAEVVHAAQRCPHMVLFNIIDNPMCRGWGGALPSPTSPAWQILGALPRLHVFNGQNVQGDILTNAVMHYGTPQGVSTVNACSFDGAVQAVIKGKGKPEELHELNLERRGLRVAYLAGFKNLRRLNLANNSLATLEKTGIEYCQQLESLNLAYNALPTVAALGVLASLPRIGTLDVRGNPLTNHPKHMHEILHTTRHARPNAFANGLVNLNGAMVTIPQKCEAIKACEGAGGESTYLWKLALQSKFGWATVELFAKKKLTSFGVRRRSVTVGATAAAAAVAAAAEAKADEAKADEAKADEAKAGEAKAGEAKAEETKAEETGEAKSSDTKEDTPPPPPADTAANNGDSKTEQKESEEKPTAATEANKGDAPPAAAETAASEGASASESKEGETKTDDSKAEETKAEETKAEETKAEETKAADDSKATTPKQAETPKVVVVEEKVLPKVIELSKRLLLQVDLALPLFEQVRVLDLSHNRLKVARGIEKLQHIQSLNLSHNPGLNIGQVLRDLLLTPTTTLVSISLLPDGNCTHGHQVGVVSSLGLHNRRLRLVDTVQINPIARQSAMANWIKAGHAFPNDSTYGAECALMSTFGPLDNASFHPEDVAVASQQLYKLEDVKTLLCFRGMGCAAAALPSMTTFAQHVVVLDLSHNALTSMQNMGIESLKLLEALDVSDNKIIDPIGAIAGVIGQLPRLTAFCVRSNPCTQDPAIAASILAAMPRPSNEHDWRLRYLDRPITRDVRMKAFEIANRLLRKKHKKQYKEALHHFVVAVAAADCADLGMSESKVPDLLLQDLALVAAPKLHSYQSLLRLELNCNKLKKLEGCGLEHCHNLRVLDLRDNLLPLHGGSEQRYLLKALNQLTSLVVLGVSGNKKGCFSRGELWKKLATHMDEVKKAECALRFVDMHYFSISDQVVAAKSSNPDDFRLQVAVARRHPTQGLDPRARNLVKQEGESLGTQTTPLHASVSLRWYDGSDAELRALHGAETHLEASSDRNTLLKALSHAWVHPQPRVPDEHVLALDLSGTLIRTVHLEGFPNLQRLDLGSNNLDGKVPVRLGNLTALTQLDMSNNSLDAACIAGCGLATLTQLKSLRLNNNNIGDRDGTWGLVWALTALEKLNLLRNPCFKKDTERRRTQFLSGVHGITVPGMPLKSLNGQPVTVAERCNAIHKGGLNAERIRLQLVVEAENVTGEETSLVLSEHQLSNIALLAHSVSSNKYCSLTDLDVSRNRISSLTGQGLAELPELTTLNLSYNCISSLTDAVHELQYCSKLVNLSLLSCTGRGDTTSVSKYSATVFAQLRGLLRLDTVRATKPWTQDQLAAIEFLQKHTDVCSNNTSHLDLRNCGFHATHFPYILGALSHLPVATIHLSSNGWDVGVGKHHSNYRRYAIAQLGSHLESVDGQFITDDERANAIQFVETEESRFGAFLKRGKWAEHDARANRAMERIPPDNSVLKRRRQARRQALLPITFGASDVVQHDDAEDEEGEDGEEDEEVEEELQQLGHKAQKQAKRQNRMESGVGAVKGQNAVAGGALAAGGAALAASLSSVSMSGILTKIEIAINFFQIYGMMLSIPVTVPWPGLWKEIASWFSYLTSFLSVDLDILWLKLDIPVPDFAREYLSFVGSMLIVAVFVLVYFYASSMSRRAWIRRYHDNCGKTTFQAILLWFVLMIGSGAGGMLFDWDTSWNNVQNGSLPSQRSMGVALVLAGGFTALYLPWLIMVACFRRKYRKPIKSGQPPGGAAFLKFWSKMKRLLQRVSLFVLTVMYMPTAKLVLRTYAPLLDEAQLKAAGCQFTDGSGQMCCLLIDPTKPCIGSSDWSSFTTHQWLALPFLLLFVFGIPLLFGLLIRYGVREVYRSGYAHRDAAHKRRMEALELELKEAQARKKAIKERKVTPSDADPTNANSTTETVHSSNAVAPDPTPDTPDKPETAATDDASGDATKDAENESADTGEGVGAGAGAGVGVGAGASGSGSGSGSGGSPNAAEASSSADSNSDSKKETTKSGAAAVTVTAKIPKGRTVKEIKKAIKEEKKRVDRLYAYEVQLNPKAQTYLYQPYNYKNRFHKLVSTIVKLVLVLVTLFVVPLVSLPSLPMYVASGVLFLEALFTGAATPFQDMMEDVMSVVGGAANFINVGIAALLGGTSPLIGDAIATLLLVIFNGTNLALILFVLIFAPCRYYMAKRKARELLKKEQAKVLSSASQRHIQLNPVQEEEGAKKKAEAAVNDDAPPPPPPSAAVPLAATPMPMPTTATGMRARGALEPLPVRT